VLNKVETTKIDIIECYRFAWNSFTKKWLILCFISGLIVGLEVIPRIVTLPEWNSLYRSSEKLMLSILKGDQAQFYIIAPLVKLKASYLVHKLLKYTLPVVPLLALLTIILLLQANRTTKISGSDTPKPFTFLLYIALIHIMLSIIKMAAFIIFIVPGIYLYIRLLFVSLVMLDQNKGVWSSIKKSYKMTMGNFWRLLFLVIINTLIQLGASFTLIGLIPATGFVNTVRAAAFRTLLNPNNRSHI